MTNNNNERVKNQFRISNWSQRTSNTAENTEFEEIDLKFTQMLHVQITSSIFLEFQALLLACALHVAKKMQTTDFMMIVNCKNKHSIWKVLFTHAKKEVSILKIDFYLHLIIEILLLPHCCGALLLPR